MLILLQFSVTHAQLQINPSYSLDFEDEAEVNEWSFEDDAMQLWTLGEEAEGDGTSLYISYDYYSYDYMNIFGPMSHFYREVEVPSAGMFIDFDYRVGGVENEDFLQIALYPPGTNLDYYNNNTPVFSVNLCCTPDEWQHIRIIVPQSMAGNKILAFTWRNNQSGDGAQPPAAIDNLEITARSCYKPTGLATTAIYTDGATISWTDPNDAEEYIIAYITEEMDDWTEISHSITSEYTFDTFEPDTEYQVKVKTVCSAEESSDFTDPITFTTLVTCQPPANPSATAVADESATINWEQGSDGNDDFMLSYTVQYEDDWTDMDVVGTTQSLSGLNPGTPYQVKISSICGVGNESEPVEFVFRTTHATVLLELPFEENFEGEIFQPVNWDYLKISGTSDEMQWMRTTDNTNSGNGAALFDAYHLSSGHKAALITPKLNFAGEVNKKLVFSIYRNDDHMEGWEEGIRVWINDSQNLTGAEELIHISRVYLYEPVEDEIGWYTYVVDISDTEIGQGYLLFEGIGDYGDNVIIDDIKVFGFTYDEQPETAAICEGESYDFYGTNLTEAGVYTHTIFTPEENTIITLTLTVEAIPGAPVITEIYEDGVTYYEADTDTGIQWYMDGDAIEDATDVRIEVSTAGDYYATSSNDCGESDPSNTITYGFSSINSSNTKAFIVYPNPAKSEINISYGGNPVDKIFIYTIDGRLVMEKDINAGSATLNVSGFDNGLYLLKIVAGEKTFTRTIKVNK